MTQPRPWIVTPHGPLERLDDNLWAVCSPVPGIEGFDRRMAIVRRDDGKLVFYNAVPVDDRTLDEIRALGTPAYLVVPQHLHMLDAPAFVDKLGVTAYTSRPSLEAARRRLPIEPIDDLPPDPALRFETVAGFRTGEVIALVTTGPRRTLLVADLIINTPRGRGFYGFVFHLMGFTGNRPKLPTPVKLRVCRDKAAVRAQLTTLAAEPGLSRVVVSHGGVVEERAAEVLREVAATV